MTKRLLVGVLLTLVGIFALSELLLPYIIGTQIKAGLAKNLGTSEIRVSVKGTSALALLGGNFSTIKVDAKKAHVEKLDIDQLSAVFINTSIDANKLLSGRTLVFREVGGFDGTITLLEQDISQYMVQKIKGMKNAQVIIMPDNMKVTGDLALGPVTMAVAMDGKLRGEQTQLKYKAEQLQLNKAAVGTSLAGSGLSTDFLLFDMKKLPVAATVRDVIMEQGRVVIRITK